MATIYDSPATDLRLNVARNQRAIFEFPVRSDFLGAATVSASQPKATLGIEEDPEDNPEITTATSVSGASAFVTVLASEFNAFGSSVEYVYLGIEITLSDARVEPVRLKLRLLW